MSPLGGIVSVNQNYDHGRERKKEQFRNIFKFEINIILV